MTTKKIFGFIFIALSIFLAIALVGRIQQLILEIGTFFKVFTGTMNLDESAKAITKFILWIIYILVVVQLWNYGHKWTKISST